MLEFLISPIVVALVVILAQFVIQPLMQKIITAQNELWLHKKKIYVNTIELIDKRFDSLRFVGAEPTGNAPTENEINANYRELLLLTDNQEIVTSFQNFMDTSLNGYASPANRGKFIQLLRIDLGKSRIGIEDDRIPYFRKRNNEISESPHLGG